MKKPMAVIAFAFVVLAGALASAAPVDIIIRRDDSVPNQWQLSSIAQVDTGNIALILTGFTGMILMPLPQISPLDSPFVGGLAGATMQITSLEGQDLIPIGQSEIVLATLIGPGLPFGSCAPGPLGFGFAAPCFGIDNGDSPQQFGYTVLNRALDTPLEYSLTIVPEPATSLLLVLGLVSLAVVRRSA